MAISQELSGDIATAIWSARKDSPLELRKLKDTILQIHTVLEQLSRTEKMRSVESRQLIRNEETEKGRAGSVGRWVGE
jgi:hypothetical protein